MYVGFQLAEYDVFLKYYSCIKEVFQDVVDYTSFVKAEIITKIDIDRYGFQKLGLYNIILIKTVSKLLSSDTNFFNKLLHTIQNEFPNSVEVIFRMQSEIMLLRLKMLHGEYIRTYVCAYNIMFVHKMYVRVYIYF